MTVFGTEALTYIELAKASNLDGTPAMMVNSLVQATPIVEDMLVKPTSDAAVHKTTHVTGLPGVTHGRLGDSYVATRGSWSDRVEGCARIMAESFLPHDPLMLLGDIPQRRMQAMQLFWPAMAHQVEYDMIYGSTITSDTMFNGFTARRTALGDFCLGAGGTTNLSSIWFANWGDGLFGIHPKHIPAGLMHTGYAKNIYPTSTTVGGGDLVGYKDTFDWYVGLSNPVDSDLIRICNIDMAAAVAGTGTQAVTAATNIQRMMVQATTHCRRIGPNAKFYLPRQLYSVFLDMAVSRALTNTFVLTTLNNRPSLQCMGVELRISDAIGYGTAAGEVQVT